MRALGLVAALFYAVHAGWHVAHGRPEDTVWACHLAALAVGGGLMARAPALCGIGVLWLSLGVPLWIIDLAGGGEFIVTSPLTHLGGLAIGLWGIRRLGMPRGLWWKAVAALLTLVGLSRLATPAASNVNLSYHVPPGWESIFPHHGLYILLLTAVSAGVFRLVEGILRRR